jgi:hypothetical protein
MENPDLEVVFQNRQTRSGAQLFIHIYRLNEMEWELTFLREIINI